MSADLSLHAYPEGDLTEEDFRVFFSSDMGSRWFDAARGSMSDREWIAGQRKVGGTDQQWIGSCLPSLPCVAAVEAVVGEECPAIDEALIERVMAAFAHAPHERLADEEAVRAWLTEHRGQRVFSVAW